MPVSPHAYEAEIMKIIVETKIGEIFSGLLNHADADFMTITNKSPAVFFWARLLYSSPCQICYKISNLCFKGSSSLVIGDLKLKSG